MDNYDKIKGMLKRNMFLERESFGKHFILGMPFVILSIILIDSSFWVLSAPSFLIGLIWYSTPLKIFLVPELFCELKDAKRRKRE